MTKSEQEHIIDNVIVENTRRQITATKLNSLLKRLFGESYDADIASVRTETHPTDSNLVRIVLVDKAQRNVAHFDISHSTLQWGEF